MLGKKVTERLKDVLKEEGMKKLIDEGPDYKKNVKPKKPYTPSKTKMNSIELNAERLREVIQLTTPFVSTMNGKVRKTKFLFQLDKILLPFSMMQIERMELETKEEIINTLLKDCKVKLREVREFWIEKPQMDTLRKSCVVTEDYYEKQRLKLVVEYGEDIVIIKEEHYEIFEDALLQMLKNAAKTKLRIQTNYEAMSNLIEKLWITILGTVPFGGNAITDLKEYYFDRLAKGMDEKEISEYQGLKIKPMEGYNFIEETSGYPNPSSWHAYLVIAKNFSVARQLIAKDEIEETVHHFVDFAYSILEREKNNTLTPEAITDKMRIENLLTIVNELPAIQRELEKV